MRKGFWVFTIVVLFIGLGVNSALGQEKEIEEMKRKIEVLTEEVEKIKLGAVAEPTYERFRGLGPAASKIYFIDKGLSVGGYGEVVYENREGGINQVDFLRGVIYFGYKFSDRILFNSEIEYEHGSTGKGGEVSVEFGYLDFRFNNPFNIRAGMVLIPVGFINEGHEPIVFHGSLRPDVDRFIIPTTWRENGVGVFGEIIPDLNYRVYVVAGLDADGFKASDGIRGGRQSGAKSRAEDLALVTRLEYRGVLGLKVAGSFYTGNSGQGRMVGGEVIDVRTTIYEADLEYLYRGLELRGLYAQINLDDADKINLLKSYTGNNSVGERMYGWYLEGAYNILPILKTGTAQYLSPFVRYERYNTQDAVPSGYLANPANDMTTITYGITYKPIPNIALKVDFQEKDNEAGTANDQFNIAIAYNF